MSPVNCQHAKLLYMLQKTDVGPPLPFAARLADSVVEGMISTIFRTAKDFFRFADRLDADLECSRHPDDNVDVDRRAAQTTLTSSIVLHIQTWLTSSIRKTVPLHPSSLHRHLPPSLTVNHSTPHPSVISQSADAESTYCFCNAALDLLLSGAMHDVGRVRRRFCSAGHVLLLLVLWRFEPPAVTSHFDRLYSYITGNLTFVRVFSFLPNLFSFSTDPVFASL